MTERERFELFISLPPYERSIERCSDDPRDTAWPEQYRYDSVQLAWEAWQAALDLDKDQS
jgi:hypothetical protein